ncbi:MAG: hypothetical protein Roseis2KO_48060 [Roseivirga sp.]
MRNFKNTFVILLILSLFSCGTQSISEDEIPNLDGRSTFGEVKDINDKSSLTMTISVVYPDNQDRTTVRAQFGPVLGLTQYTNCSSRAYMETWEVNLMTEYTFFKILENFNVVTRSVSSAGASDPYDKHDTKVVFVYGGTCQ